MGKLKEAQSPRGSKAKQQNAVYGASASNKSIPQEGENSNKKNSTNDDSILYANKERTQEFLSDSELQLLTRLKNFEFNKKFYIKLAILSRGKHCLIKGNIYYANAKEAHPGCGHKTRQQFMLPNGVALLLWYYARLRCS